MIIRVEAIATGPNAAARDRNALTEDERERLQAAVDAALPGRTVNVVVARTSTAEPDFAALANLLTGVYHDSDDLEAAVRVVVHASRRGHCDVRAAEVNAVVAEVARWHGLEPKSIVGMGRSYAVTGARAEVWAILKRRGLLIEAIAAAFEKHKSNVSRAVAKVEARAEKDAQLRARLTWMAAGGRRREAA